MGPPTTTAGGGSGGGVKAEAGAPGLAQAIRDVTKVLQADYRDTTPKRLKMLDMFLVFVFATGVLQVGRIKCVMVKPLCLLLCFYCIGVVQLLYSYCVVSV